MHATNLFGKNLGPALQKDVERALGEKRMFGLTTSNMMMQATFPSPGAPDSSKLLMPKGRQRNEQAKITASNVLQTPKRQVDLFGSHRESQTQYPLRPIVKDVMSGG